jgi:hypothetical protein
VRGIENSRPRRAVPREDLEPKRLGSDDLHAAQEYTAYNGGRGAQSKEGLMAEEERRPRTPPQDDEAAARRRQLIEEAKARWAAKRAASEGTAAPGKPQTEPGREERVAAARARPEAAWTPRMPPAAAPWVEVFVASQNPGASPVSPPQNPVLRAFGTINQAIEIEADPGEEQNLRKLLGGLGLYQNPLRQNRFQLDYRYWREAKKRLEAAGYRIEQRDFMGRPLDDWDPLTRGWVRARLE